MAFETMIIQWLISLYAFKSLCDLQICLRDVQYIVPLVNCTYPYLYLEIRMKD